MQPFTDYVITIAADGTEQELVAANELAYWLSEMTHTTFDVMDPSQAHGKPQFAVGTGSALL